MTLMGSSNVAGLLARQFGVAGAIPGPLVTTLLRGTINLLGAANTVLTTDGVTAGGAWALIVNANVDAAAAIVGTKVVPDFGAQDIITTGTLSLGVTPATAGRIRIASANTVQWRNAGNTGNVNALVVNGADIVQLGDTGEGVLIQGSNAGTIALETGGFQRFRAQAGGVRVTGDLTFAETTATPAILQEVEADAVNSVTLTMRAQDNTNAGAFNGGDLALSSGSSVGGNAGSTALQVAGTPHFTITAAGEANFEVPSPALGGGAAATLGTIGGAGPTVAGQNQWLQIEIDATTHWVAVWV